MRIFFILFMDNIALITEMNSEELLCMVSGSKVMKLILRGI